MMIMQKFLLPIILLPLIAGCGLTEYIKDVIDDDRKPTPTISLPTEPPAEVTSTPTVKPTVKPAPTNTPTPSGPVNTEIEERQVGGGFLWKPQADNTPKNLVILLPSSFNNVTAAVELHRSIPPSAATLIERGRYTGIANGNRGHWRYGQPGAAYGQNVVVLVLRHDGSRVAYRIADGAQRTE
jgi:hypothetical protein